MIDLTQEPPMKQRKTTTVADAISQPEKSAVNVFSPPSDPFQRFSSPNPPFRHSVTFAPSTVHRTPSPDDENDIFPASHPFNVSKNGNRLL